jgi:hypothetical protein
MRSAEKSGDPTVIRRFSRFKVSAPVLIQRGNDRPCLGMTSDAAVGGCCLVVGDAIGWSVGDTLFLTFEDDQLVCGTIRWIGGIYMAVEFEQPLLCLVLDDAGRPVTITVDEMQPQRSRGDRAPL